MVTRWQTPFQHPHVMPAESPEEKSEYLRIQCSSNTVDNIYIQKQKLSVYRLGLSNVGTLSDMQAIGCIDTINVALHKLSSVRSRFGAYQYRLEHAYNINRNAHENTQSAESVIRDTDYGKGNEPVQQCEYFGAVRHFHAGAGKSGKQYCAFSAELELCKNKNRIIR